MMDALNSIVGTPEFRRISPTSPPAFQVAGQWPSITQAAKVNDTPYPGRARRCRKVRRGLSIFQGEVTAGRHGMDQVVGRRYASQGIRQCYRLQQVAACYIDIASTAADENASGRRTRHRTRCDPFTRRRSNRLPMYPVAPVMRTVSGCDECVGWDPVMHLLSRNEISRPSEPTPARYVGRLPDPVRHLLRASSSSFVDVDPARVPVLA